VFNRNGDLWRTTADIADRWTSLDQIGFGTQVPRQRTQLDIASFMRPAQFNDPYMLEVHGGMTDDVKRWTITTHNQDTAESGGLEDFRTRKL
jgi:hypothetical protein